jgi:hypothetical protein
MPVKYLVSPVIPDLVLPGYLLTSGNYEAPHFSPSSPVTPNIPVRTLFPNALYLVSSFA